MDITQKKLFLQTEAEEEVLTKKRSKKTETKYKARQRFAKVESALEEQFATGRVLGMEILFSTYFIKKKLYIQKHKVI